MTYAGKSEKMAVVQDVAFKILPTTQYKCICSSCFKRKKHLYGQQKFGTGWQTGAIKTAKKRTVEDMNRRLWKNCYLKTFHRYWSGVVPGARKLRERRKAVDLEVVEPVNEIPCSIVFLESLTIVGERQQLPLDLRNFWDFVFSDAWRGRLRLCEGELTYRIKEILKELVRTKKITKFTSTRYFYSGNAPKTQKTDTAETTTAAKCNSEVQSKNATFVTKVVFIFYGGTPITPKKMVQFNTPPFAVFTPRLRCITPILKQVKTTTVNQKLNATSPSSSSPAINDASSGISVTQQNGSNESETPEGIYGASENEFASFCSRAVKHFVVVEEIITNSRTLTTTTSFTLRRKESLAVTNEIAESMKDFYTSTKLPEYSYNFPLFKPGTRLLEMTL